MNYKKEIQEELKIIGIMFLIISIILKVVFFKSSLLRILLFSFGLIYGFFIPGLMITLFWKDKFDTLERIGLSFSLGLAILGLITYYTGIIGLNLRYSSWITPSLVIIICLILKNKESHENTQN